MVSLGCAKNLVDSEILLGGLKKENFDIINNPEESDIIIVNTCGFLDTAREESIETILDCGKLKKTSNVEKLVTWLGAAVTLDFVLKDNAVPDKIVLSA